MISKGCAVPEHQAAQGSSSSQLANSRGQNSKGVLVNGHHHEESHKTLQATPFHLLILKMRRESLSQRSMFYTALRSSGNTWKQTSTRQEKKKVQRVCRLHKVTH